MVVEVGGLSRDIKTSRIWLFPPHAGGCARCALAVSCLPQLECWMDGMPRPIGCTPPLLATRHPQVAVEPDAIFVHDGRVWSSAGVTTGIDLALALIAEDAGRQVAMNVARMLVVYLKRAGGQSQYSALLAAQAESDSESFSELERWIVEHLKSDLSVNALANRVHMSPRNFARVYAAKRGRTPAKMVEAIRVDAARRRLEETDDRIEAVAEGCGFGSEEQMRCAFLRILRIPPRDYRKRFSSTAMRGLVVQRDAGS